MNNKAQLQELLSIGGSDSRDNMENLVSIWESSQDVLKSSLSKDMVDRGVINDSSLSSIISFFLRNNIGNASLYRRTQSQERIESYLWAKIVEDKVNQSYCNVEYPNYKQSNLDSNFILELKSLSQDEDCLPEVRNMLREIGIILVYEEPLKRSKTDGVAGRTLLGNPYIGMSLRFHRLDYFWFTLMHELGHVYYHLDILDNPILDSEDLSFDNNDEVEAEANAFAQNNLISRQVWRSHRLKGKYKISKDDIYAVAKDASVHPAVVAGRLRKELGDYSIFSDLVNKINVRDYLC